MKIDGVLLDIDGVLVVSWEPVPGAGSTLEWLRERDIPFALVTNTTTLSRQSLAAQLAVAGLDVEADRLVTAPVATAAYLRTNYPGVRCFLIAKGDVVEDLEGVELVEDRADVVVIGGAEEALTYEAMNQAFRMLLDGATLVAMQRNTWWMTSEGPKLDAGPYVTALEEAAGVRAVVVGKPSPEIFRESLSLLGVPADHAAMIGDDLESDVIPAQNLGLAGILVRTGKFRQESLTMAARQPDQVIDSVADLPALLSEDR